MRCFNKPELVMRLLCSLLPVVLVVYPAFSQQHLFPLIHSHNDYKNSTPFFMAYKAHVGSLEADVFLKKGELYVAHIKSEIKRQHTLDSLYLKPLALMLNRNTGFIYSDSTEQLIFLIDLKTKGASTLARLVERLTNYPIIISATSLKIVVSGNVPDPSVWSSYPDHIYFDGRPYLHYTLPQLDRIIMMSDNFTKYSAWKGVGPMPLSDSERLKAIINFVHSKGKKVRFWATPDMPDAWQTLIALGVDYISTDKVSEVSQFIKEASARDYSDDH
jgi:alkaline phosphatase